MVENQCIEGVYEQHFHIWHDASSGVAAVGPGRACALPKICASIEFRAHSYSRSLA